MSGVMICPETAIAVVGAPSTASTPVWDQLAGTTAPFIETTVVRAPETRSYGFTAGAVSPYLRRTHPASQTVGYFVGYFRLTAVPSSLSYLQILGLTAGSQQVMGVTSGGVLQMSFNGSGLQSGPTLAANTWYGIEFEVDVTANPNVIKWRTWDSVGGWVSRTNVSFAQAATTIAHCRIGIPAGVTSGLSVYWTDGMILEGTTPGQYYDASRAGGGRATRYLPNADGTHSFTAGDFGYNAAGGDVATSATDVYTYLDESDQTGITDFIRQKVARTTAYVEVAFPNEAVETVPRAVAIISAHHSDGTGANQQGISVTDDGGTSLTTLWSANDVSDTSAAFRSVVLHTKPSGGAWTQAAVNSLTVRLGYSNDVSAIPYWDNVSVVVFWGDPASLSRTATDSVARGDAATRQLTLGRGTVEDVTLAINDYLTASDAATRAIAYARAATDALVRSDVATRSVGVARATADALTGSDVAVVVKGVARSVVDAVARSDVATRAQASARTASDAVARADSVVRGNATVRAVADALTRSDSPVRAVALLRAMAEASSRADAVARALTITRATTDSLARSDVAVRAKSTARTASDAVARSDVVVRAVTLSRSLTDAVTRSDASARVVAFGRSAVDSMAAGDVAARVHAIVRAASDALSASDAVTRGVGRLRVVAESLFPADAANRTTAASRATTDAMGASDSALRTHDAARAATDALGAANAPARGLGLTRGATDALTASNAPIRLLSLLRGLVEGIAHADAVTSFKTGGQLLLRTASESLGASDAAARALAMARGVAEATGLTDAVARALGITRVSADTVFVGQAANRQIDASRSIADGMQASDAVASGPQSVPGTITIDPLRDTVVVATGAGASVVVRDG